MCYVCCAFSVFSILMAEGIKEFAFVLARDIADLRAEITKSL